MRLILYMVVFAVLTIGVLGVPAGTVTEVYHFDKCDSLRVDVSGELHINDSEYELIGCDETEKNSWYCDCTNDYSLKLNTKINTINNYSFYMQYNYSVEREETSSSSSGGRGSSYPSSVPTGGSEIIYIFDDKEDFRFDDQTHTITYNGEIDEGYNFTVRSDPVEVILKEGENETIVIGESKLNVKLDRVSSSYFRFKLTDMGTVTKAATTTSTTTTTEKPKEQIEESTNNKSVNITDEISETIEIETTTNKTSNEVEKESFPLIKFVIGVGLLILLLLGIHFLYKREKGENE